MSLQFFTLVIPYYSLANDEHHQGSGEADL
jgi:hypothetical protein